jgi:hypothetical protein
MQNKKAMAFFMLFLTIGFAFGYSINFYQHGRLKITANVYVFKESPEGIELILGNTLTDWLERDVRNIIGFANGSTVAYKYITLGNSSIAQTKTILDTEATTSGFGRALGTVTAWESGTDFAFNVTKKFTATGTITINACGLQNSATPEADNTLGALASLGGSQTFLANWNCTIVYSLIFNFN